MLTSFWDDLNDKQREVITAALTDTEFDLTNPEFYSNALVYNTPGVTQFSLAKLSECESNQNPINVTSAFNKVLKPLVTTDEFTLYYPIEVGFIDDDTTFYIMSGHHRTAALLTLVDAVERLNSMKPGELLEQITIPVVMRPYHPALLLAANQSRSVGRGEKINIELARQNIDTSDIDTLKDAALRNVPGALLRAAYVLCHESDDSVLFGLTDTTVANITRSAVSKLSKMGKLTSSVFAAQSGLFLDEFVTALSTVLHEQDVNNIARNATFIGEQVAKWYKTNSEWVHAIMREKIANDAQKLSKKLTNTRKRIRNPIQPVGEQLSLFE